MQQRRLRLGDILDDYCPRERRVTNHVVVAMIDDEVKQTRCTTCDADHEYKEARVPVSRRKKTAAEPPDAPGLVPLPAVLSPADPEAPMLAAADEPAPVPDPETDPDASPASPPIDDDGPVHRPLIRATLPRPEGQVPERKEPEFTIRQPPGRGREQGGKRGRNRGRRHAAAGGQTGPLTRFGGPPQGQRQGSGRPRPNAGQHGERGERGARPPGAGRGPRPDAGRGPKRGR